MGNSFLPYQPTSYTIKITLNYIIIKFLCINFIDLINLSKFSGIISSINFSDLSLLLIKLLYIFSISKEYIKTQKDIIYKDVFYIPKRLEKHFDGYTLFFNITKKEAKQYKMRLNYCLFD